MHSISRKILFCTTQKRELSRKKKKKKSPFAPRKRTHLQVAYMRKESLCSPRVPTLDGVSVVCTTSCKLTSVFNSGREVVPGMRFSPNSRSASALSTSLLEQR